MQYESEQFHKKIHGNSFIGLVKALFDSKKISEEDISELEKMLEEKKK